MRTRKAQFALVSLVLLMLLFALSACISSGNSLDPEDFKHTFPSEYYFYLPEGYSDNKYWPVFIGIHEFGGSGRDCWNLWQQYADEDEFILICPSLADASGGWSQPDAEQRLIAIINQVFRDYRIQNQVFLVGFSAGAQFVQGFAFRYPGYVSAVAVLSSGNFFAPSQGVLYIPFLVVVGDEDNSSLIDGASSFVQSLQSIGVSAEFHLLEGVGHTVAPESKDLTLQLFRKTASP